MLNPNQLPGTGSIADSVEFVKKLWGIPSAGAFPGMMVPTLSLEDINKKISDLKAVESWMTVNMNMLRGTIQALEVQSATIVNLQSMGAMLGVRQDDMKTESSSGTATAGFPFSFPVWPTAAAPQAEAEPAPPPEPSPPLADVLAESTAAAPAAGMPDPNAWWDLLQNQFKQAVGAALAPDATKVMAASVSPRKRPVQKAVKASAKPVKKSAAKKAPVQGRVKTTAEGVKKS